MQGQCKYFDAAKHYGFIWTEAGEFFFHQTDVIGPLPSRGAGVEFWLDDPLGRGLQAIEVQVIIDRIETRRIA